MKRTLSFLSLIVLCMTAMAQNSIQLNIDHRLGASEFALNQQASQDSYVFNVTRLQYYISDIEITHDGGMNTAIEDVWILVNANGTGDFDLGLWQIDQVEAVSFYVGVGQEVNHNDPAAWPSSSPLSPQNPSMHWGWSSGYRFVAMEGNAGASSPANLYQIHALGDNNYFQTNVTVSSTMVDGTVVIPLNADYVQALDGIDVSSGIINHSTSGVSIPLLQNFSTDVFTAGTVTSIPEFDFSSSLVVTPNPSSSQARLKVELPQGMKYSLSIIDITGKTVAQERVSVNQGVMDLPTMVSGIYMINLMSSNEVLTSIRWVVE
jgi:hypothetical protein